MQHLQRPTHLQGFTKLIILPDYKLAQIICLALRPHKIVPKSDCQSKFSVSKIIQIIPFFFIEEYEISSTTFINTNFCLLSFLKHFNY